MQARADDLERLREGGATLATILRALTRLVRPGVATAALDDAARGLMREHGASPSFLGYRQYPAAVCTSRNENIVHGIPSRTELLREGDILGLDIGILYRGRITDMAVTVPVGRVTKAARRLIDVTRESLSRSIAALCPGMTTGDLGNVIQTYVEGEGFSVIRDLVGHGVGLAVHEDPMIPNFGTPGTGDALREGMVVAIEPMVSAGGWRVRTLRDGWTVATADGSLGAHFEHTVVITNDGADILTQTHGRHPWP